MNRCPGCNAGPAWCWLRHAGRCDRLAEPHWAAHNAARSALPPPPSPGIRPHPDSHLAPLRVAPDGSPINPGGLDRSWEGRAARRPWEYRVAAAIVHLDTPDLLRAVVATLRAQTERPYIVVVDTGSLSGHRADLEALERDSDDLEVHSLRPRGWSCTSQPCAAAMDVAWAVTQSEYSYATHVDVFLKRPDFLEYLLGLCDARTPVVGYQMSPRPASGNDWWRRTPSHTATLYHMPTMRRLGIHWNMLGAFERAGLPVVQPRDTGWPDTETYAGMLMEAGGLVPRRLGGPAPGPDGPPSILLLGPEPNEPYDSAGWDGRPDGWLRHERSTTCRNLYNPEAARLRRDQLDRSVAAALADAARWTRRAGKVRVPLGRPHPKPGGE